MPEICTHEVQTYKVTHPQKNFGAKTSFGKCADCGETVSKLLVIKDYDRFTFSHSNHIPGDELKIENQDSFTDFVGAAVIPMRKEEIEGK